MPGVAFTNLTVISRIPNEIGIIPCYRLVWHTTLPFNHFAVEICFTRSLVLLNSRDFINAYASSLICAKNFRIFIFSDSTMIISSCLETYAYLRSLLVALSSRSPWLISFSEISISLSIGLSNSFCFIFMNEPSGVSICWEESIIFSAWDNSLPVSLTQA